MNSNQSTVPHPSASLPLPQVQELYLVQYKSNAGHVTALYSFAGSLRINAGSGLPTTYEGKTKSNKVSATQAAAMLAGTKIIAEYFTVGGLARTCTP